jgi:hypothetical protein
LGAAWAPERVYVLSQRQLEQTAPHFAISMGDRRGLSSGDGTGPATSRYDGTHAVFHVSSVASHLKHSKLFTSRAGAIASVR